MTNYFLIHFYITHSSKSEYIVYLSGKQHINEESHHSHLQNRFPFGSHCVALVESNAALGPLL